MSRGFIGASIGASNGSTVFQQIESIEECVKRAPFLAAKFS